MGEVLKQINEHTRLVSMMDEDYSNSWFVEHCAMPDGDCYPPTMIFADGFTTRTWGKFPLTMEWLSETDHGSDHDALARHIRMALGLRDGDVVAQQIISNNQDYATMVVIATEEWREMTGYREDLKSDDYSEIEDWWVGDYDVAVVERLETTVTVRVDGSTEENEEWIEDSDNYAIPVYGYGKRAEIYLDEAVIDSERLPTRYVGKLSVSVTGSSKDAVQQDLREKVAQALGFTR